MAEDGMLWGGRFSEGPDPELLRLTSSIEVDIELLRFDAEATRAHAHVLAAAGLLTQDALTEIDRALDELLEKWNAGTLEVSDRDEDVHSLVERYLTERLGDVGARIHAGRSRNDLVATDLRLWSKAAATSIAEQLAELLEALAARAEEHAATTMPGLTHMQPGQPISVGFHLLAHAFALARDGERVLRARDSADVSALGAGALAGSTLTLAPSVAADKLGFSAVFDNALDATADRDFACDLLYALAMLGVHLSRLAEEIVLWTSPLVGFAALPEAWSTGSSMMPNKRNPDMAELVRGRAAGAISDLAGLLVLLKGLPLGYGRDLQEDKEGVFRAVERSLGCLVGMSALVRGLRFDAGRLEEAAGLGGTWATDLAEILVARGVPFRDAHRAVGELVGRLEPEGRSPSSRDILATHQAFEPADIDSVDAGRAMRARRTPGGTAPERVAEQVAAIRERGAALRSA